MPRRIQVLPDEVANQIAAGEVVERPASVVRELVENALDARATRIDVRIERGGKTRIRVADDGVGMSREDALLCLDRHATSKIREADDLRRVRSFGFRGEALPSIAAVSRMTLETREGGEEVGTRLTVKGGKLTSVDDCARRRGTTVEVRRLFFNAPARAKFLKSVSAEARAVSETIASRSLAHPEVGLTLASDDRSLLDLAPANGLVDRVAQLWGTEAAGTLLPVSAEDGAIRIEGLVQRPDAARAGLRRAYLFVNGRPFRDPGVVQAVDRGYRTTIPSGVRPWLFLHLRVEEGGVDVNVHPQKAEVRFRDRNAVEGFVEETVREALGGAGSSAAFDTSAGSPTSVRERPADELGWEGSRPAASGGGASVGRRGVPETQMALFLAGSGGGGVEGDASVSDGEGTGEEAAPGSPELPVGRPRLWQVLDTYVLAETRDGVLIIDQHSAHERVLFERLMDAFAAGGQEGQRLLFPLTIKLAPQEVEQVESLKGLLARAGFEVEGFGGDTVIVRSVPNPHPWFDAERCFREMIQELTHGSELIRAAGNQHERIAMTFACKGAIKAGQRLGAAEMEELFEALFATALPYHDVHGRPTVVRLSSDELERKFGRH